MNQDYIQFKKQRELGDILSDTFKFVREEFKTLFSVIIKQVGPAFILLALGIGYYSYVTLGNFDNPFLAMTEGGFNIGETIIAAIILLISVLVYVIMLYGTVIHYIKSYIENNGKVIPEEIQRNMRNDFGSLSGLTVLTWIIMFFGFVLCFFPGIYVMVPLALTFPILIFDRLSVSDSISHSFTLVKDNWWMTFAFLLVIMIIVYVISMVFSLPMIIYTFIKGFTMAQEGSSVDPTSLFDWIYILLNILSSLIQYLLYTITTIATVFIYFDLKEKKYHTGTYESIESLGQDQ